MKAPSVTLIKQRQKLTGGRTVAYWRLRWPGKDGRPRTESIGTVGEMTEAEAAVHRLEADKSKLRDALADPKLYDGGNEKLVELPALETGEYTYICTVPGHESMTGTLVVSE